MLTVQDYRFRILCDFPFEGSNPGNCGCLFVTAFEVRGKSPRDPVQRKHGTGNIKRTQHLRLHHCSAGGPIVCSICSYRPHLSFRVSLFSYLLSRLSDFTEQMPTPEEKKIEPSRPIGITLSPCHQTTICSNRERRSAVGKVQYQRSVFQIYPLDPISLCPRDVTMIYHIPARTARF